jgi:hypothetical protein
MNLPLRSSNADTPFSRYPARSQPDPMILMKTPPETQPKVQQKLAADPPPPDLPHRERRGHSRLIPRPRHVDQVHTDWLANAVKS